MTVIATEVLTAGAGWFVDVLVLGVSTLLGPLGVPFWLWSDAVDALDGRFISESVVRAKVDLVH